MTQSLTQGVLPKTVGQITHNYLSL